MYKGYYMDKQRREQDKYDGLLTKQQESDLDNATDVPIKKVNKTYIDKKLKQQQGASNALSDPLGRGYEGGCWR